MKPLNDQTRSFAYQKMMKKKTTNITPWQWDPAQQSAFDTIMEELSLPPPPVLAYTDVSKPFNVHTDASLDGSGLVLYQEQSVM